MTLPQNAQSTQRVTTAVPVAAGSLPARRQVMNPPAQAEAGNLANTAPRQSEHDDARRGMTGTSSCPEARPVTATAHLSKPDLTPREREVLALRVDYWSYREIARKLGVEVSTVHAHMKHICEKFQPRTQGELYRRARNMGIGS